MSELAMVTLVVAITQYAKTWIKKLFPQFPMDQFMSVALAALVSAGVVGFSYLEAGTPFVLSAFLSAVVGVVSKAALGKMAIKPAFKAAIKK